MRVFTEIQRFNQWWLVLLMTVITAIVIGFLAVGYTKNEPEALNIYLISSILPAVITIVLTGAIFMVKLQTKIDEKGIQYGFRPFQKKLRLASWEEIDSVYIRKYKALSEFGGWGYKFSLKGRGKVYNTKGNMGIQIVFKDGKKTLIGTQKPNEVKQIIATYTSKKTSYEI